MRLAGLARLARVALAASLLSGCTHNDAVAEVLIRGAIFAGSTAVENSADCPTDCPTGRPCNKATGFCERVPCDNRCLQGESCVQDTKGERCARLASADAGTPSGETTTSTRLEP